MSRSSRWRRQSELLADGTSGLLGPFQRRRDEIADVALGQVLGRRPGLLLARVGQAEAGQPAVQDPVGVAHLTVPQQVDDSERLHFGQSLRPAPRRAACGRRRQRGGDALDRRVVVRRGHEPRLERAGRQVDAGVEHGVEERRVAERLGRLGLGEVRHRRLGEEHREQVAGVLDLMDDAGLG